MYQHNIDVFTVNVLQTLACAETSHLKKKQVTNLRVAFIVEPLPSQEEVITRLV